MSKSLEEFMRRCDAHDGHGVKALTLPSPAQQASEYVITAVPSGVTVSFSDSLEQRLSGARAQPVTRIDLALTKEREAATQAERARILAALEKEMDKIRPTEQPYTRLEWRWEERGARAMYEKAIAAVTAAIGGQEQKGGA